LRIRVCKSLLSRSALSLLDQVGHMSSNVKYSGDDNDDDDDDDDDTSSLTFAFCIII